MEHTDPNSLIETTKDSKEVFKGALLHVFKDTAILPNANTSTREWIKHPGASAVVPVFENGDIILLEQYRYPVQEVCIEIPAGKLDPGEEPIETAERELLEESGYEAGELIEIGKFYPGVGYSNEIIYIFAAMDLTEREMNADEDEFLIRKRVSMDEALKMIETGEILDGKTIICLLRVRDWLKNQKTT